MIFFSPFVKKALFFISMFPSFQWVMEEILVCLVVVVVVVVALFISPYRL